MNSIDSPQGQRPLDPSISGLEEIDSERSPQNQTPLKEDLYAVFTRDSGIKELRGLTYEQTREQAPEIADVFDKVLPHVEKNESLRALSPTTEPNHESARIIADAAWDVRDILNENPTLSQSLQSLHQQQDLPQPPNIPALDNEQEPSVYDGITGYQIFAGDDLEIPAEESTDFLQQSLQALQNNEKHSEIADSEIEGSEQESFVDVAQSVKQYPSFDSEEFDKAESETIAQQNAQEQSGSNIPGLDYNSIDGEYKASPQTPPDTFQCLDKTGQEFIQDFVDSEPPEPATVKEASVSEIMNILNQQVSASTAQEQINQAALEAIDNLQSQLNEVTEAFQDFQEQIAEANVLDTVKSVQSSFSARISNAIESVKEWAKEKVQSVQQAVENFKQWGQDRAQDTKQSVDDRVQDAKQYAGERVQGAKQAVGAFAVDNLNAASKFVAQNLGQEQGGVFSVQGATATLEYRNDAIAFQQISEAVISQEEQQTREQIIEGLSQTGEFSEQEVESLAERFFQEETSKDLKIAIALDAGLVTQEEALELAETSQKEEIEI